MIRAGRGVAGLGGLSSDGGIFGVIFNDIGGAVAVLTVSQGKDEGRQCHRNDDGGKNHCLGEWISTIAAIRLGLAAIDGWRTRRSTGLQHEEIGAIAQQ